jgi:hypothetical protein
MDKDCNLENRVGIEMDQLDLLVIKESVQEITDREAKSVLKERRKHHNILCVGCWDVFHDGRMPLKHSAIREKGAHH